MEDSSALLKYIFQDDIFIIDEPKILDPTNREQAKIISDSDTEQTKIEEPNPPAYQKTASSETELPVTFFGQNSTGILILVRDSKNDLIAQSDLDFLMKIIEDGLKFSKNDFALVNTKKWSLRKIYEEIPHDFLISFDEKKDGVSKTKALYKMTEIGGKKELYADSLSEIASDISKKKLLWSELKKMFNI